MNNANIEIEEEKVLKPAEVAKLLRVDEKTVLNWAGKGELEHTKIGSTYRFNKQYIMRLVRGE